MTPDQLSDLLYAIGMESQTGYRQMRELCAAVGVPYPPQAIQKGEPAPVTLAFDKEVNHGLCS